jgi:hypothetical protein
MICLKKGQGLSGQRFDVDAMPWIGVREPSY